MHRTSPRAVLIGLIIPGLLSLSTVGAILLLIPQAPDAIVMQWSSGGASRYAPPAELLFLPPLALGVSALMWAIAPADKPRDARLGFTIANGVCATLNASALTLLTSQLSGPATESLPGGALIVSFVAGLVVALITFFTARNTPAHKPNTHRCVEQSAE